MKLIKISIEEFDSIYIAEELSNNVIEYVDEKNYKSFKINNCVYVKVINFSIKVILIISLLNHGISNGTIYYICSVDEKEVDKIYDEFMHK